MENKATFQLTRQEIETFLYESATFRKVTARQLVAVTEDSLAKECVAKYPTNKIGAIKMFRERARVEGWDDSLKYAKEKIEEFMS